MTDAPTTPTCPIPTHLADLMAEFPPHSEWECGGRRLTAVGINSKMTTVLAEHDHILVRVPIEDARATWVRVVPAPPCPVDEPVTLRAHRDPHGDDPAFTWSRHFVDEGRVPALTLHPAGTVLPEGTPHGVYTWNGGTA